MNKKVVVSDSVIILSGMLYLVKNKVTESVIT